MSSSISSNGPVVPATAVPTKPGLSSGEVFDQTLKNLPSIQNQMQRNIDQYSKAGAFEWVPFVGGKDAREQKLAAAQSAKENADFFIRKLYDLLQQVAQASV